MLKDPRTVDFIVHEAVSLGVESQKYADLVVIRRKIEQSDEVYSRASIYLYGTSQTAEKNKAKFHDALKNLFSLVRSDNA